MLAGQKSHVSALIAVTGVLAVLASFAVASILQRRALGFIQLPGVLSELGQQGAAVIDEVYPDPVGPGGRPAVSAGQPATQSLSAPADGILQEIDVPALVRLAQAADGTIRLHAALGDSLSEGDPVLSVSSRARIDEHQLHSCLAIGKERTFTQDPRYVLRILADIAARALSPAVNDPTTAADVLNVIERLLKRLAGRDLDVGVATDAAGTARVLRPCPGWEDFLAVGLDEIRLYGTGSLQVCRRLASLLEGLAAVSPASRRAAVADQLERLRRSVPDAFPDPADQMDALVADRQGLGAAGPAGRLTERR